MDIERVKDILAQLARGVDPVTGEVFAQDSPYNHPEIIRALFIALEELPRIKKPKLTLQEKQQNNLAEGRPLNAGLPWTKESQDELADCFRQGQSLVDLATLFQRTTGAIRSQLEHQGLISFEADY